MGKLKDKSKPRYLPPIFGFDRLFPELARAERNKRSEGSAKVKSVKTIPASQDGLMNRAGFPDGARILISGEAGCGKTTFALAIIRALMMQWRDRRYRNVLHSINDKFCEIPFAPSDSDSNRTGASEDRQLYYLSTEITWDKLERLFGQYGWFLRNSLNSDNRDNKERHKDRVFDRDHVRLPRIPEASMSLPVQGAHPLVDLVLAQLKADLEKSPLMPAFVLVDSLTAILKDSRDAGERRREALDFMHRIEQAMGDERHALTFLIAERAPEPDQVAYAEEIAADFVFRLGYRPTSAGRFLRTFRITKAAGVEMHLGEHSWGIVAGQTGLDAVVASRPLAEHVRRLAHVTRRKNKLNRPWGTICVFPRPIFPSIGTLNEDTKDNDLEQPDKRTPENISSGTPGLDQLLNQKVAGNYWVESALLHDPQGRSTGEALIPGTTTLLVGTAGSGKTAACLQFLNFRNDDEAEDALNGRLYVNFENPKSQLHKLSNRNEAFDLLFKKAEMIYRRRGNLDINVLLSEIEFVIRKNKIDRVVIDGLSDLLTTTKKDDYARLVEALLSTIREASGENRASTFITFELDDEQTHQGLIAIEGLSAAADNVVVLRQMPIGDELRKAAYVLKARGMSHDPHVREVHIDNNKQFPLRIVAGLESFSGLLRGEPHPVEIVLQLFAENDAERRFNKQLLERLQGLFQHKVEAFGFSRSSLNRTLDDIASPSGRIPPSDIKVVSLDEWWIREFDARAKERQKYKDPKADMDPAVDGQSATEPPEHPLLPLELFFQTSDSDPRRVRHLTSQAQFWLLEIEKATIHEPALQKNSKRSSKAKRTFPTTPVMPEVRLYGVPNYTDFGLFCLNPEIAKGGHLNELGKKWPEVLDHVPRAWIKDAALSKNAIFGFEKPNEVNPSVLVDWFAKLQLSDPTLWGFCFDSETVESTSCMFLELCWSFGADEDFLSDESSSNYATQALSLLQYLVYYGLMPPRPKLEDSSRSLFSRQWYSTLVEHSELLALPFFPVGLKPGNPQERLKLIGLAMVDAASRVYRLATRVHFAILYRGASKLKTGAEKLRQRCEQFNDEAADLGARPDSKEFRRLLSGLRKVGSDIRALALRAPQLARGYPVKGNQAVSGLPHMDLKEGLTAALVMNVRDVLELLRWHELRLNLIEAELEHKTIAHAIDPKMVSQAEPDTNAIRALSGYCCSGSWMVGVGRRTHSPLLSWKLIEEITSSEQAVNRSQLGAGIPARKDFFDAYGETQVVNAEHLKWNDLLLYAGCRARHRHRLVKDDRPLRDRFESIHAVVLHCLSLAQAARADVLRADAMPPNSSPQQFALSIAENSLKAAHRAAKQGVKTLYQPQK